MIIEYVIILIVLIVNAPRMRLAGYIAPDIFPPYTKSEDGQ